MILVGDCLLVMPTLEANSIDAIVSDPPYGLGFMGKDWDHGIPGEHFWREALRVAKPGAHLVAFGGTRTYHRLACAIEDAGWEIRDSLMWVYGSGFPKSLDVSKAIDKAAGVDREVSGVEPRRPNPRAMMPGGDGLRTTDASTRYDIPATTEAAQWQGWGTALKPAWEPIILARKPLQGTVAANVLRHGTGGLNIDACRIEGVPPSVPQPDFASVNGRATHLDANRRNGDLSQAPGRWPANVIHDGSDEVVGMFPCEAGGGFKRRGSAEMIGKVQNDSTNFAFRQTNQPIGFGDEGSAARFFYTAKACREDRNWGCDGFGERPLHWSSGSQNPGSFQAEGTKRAAANNHPTVKPHELMRWLCRLVTPPGGLILDPFCGSGSTGRAALAEGFRFVGIELDPEYAAIAEARIHATQPGLAL